MASDEFRVRGLLLIGLLGGLGGAINAALCLFGWPVAPEYIGDTVFRWHLIPAGALHGALLAVFAVVSVALAKKLPTFVQWLMVPIVGLLAGWVAFIPLDLSLVENNRTISVLWWPWNSSVAEALTGLLLYFGLVAAFYYAALLLLSRRIQQPLVLHLAAGILSGCLGSLWWWMQFEPWWLSLLHGAIWGLLVGFGTWKSQEALAPR